MSAGRAGALLIVIAAVSGCGTTLVEVDEPVRPTATTEAGSDATVELSTESSTADVLAEIENLLRGLDQEIIDDEFVAAETLERIDAAWAIVEPRIADADSADLFNFEQALELATSGVERRRPADASKGLKIFGDVADAFLDR